MFIALESSSALRSVPIEPANALVRGVMSSSSLREMVGAFSIQASARNRNSLTNGTRRTSGGLT
jgi:hypothetical protein